MVVNSPSPGRQPQTGPSWKPLRSATWSRWATTAASLRSCREGQGPLENHVGDEPHPRKLKTGEFTKLDEPEEEEEKDLGGEEHATEWVMHEKFLADERLESWDGTTQRPVQLADPPKELLIPEHLQLKYAKESFTIGTARKDGSRRKRGPHIIQNLIFAVREADKNFERRELLAAEQAFLHEAIAKAERNKLKYPSREADGGDGDGGRAIVVIFRTRIDARCAARAGAVPGPRGHGESAPRPRRNTAVKSTRRPVPRKRTPKRTGVPRRRPRQPRVERPAHHVLATGDRRAHGDGGLCHLMTTMARRVEPLAESRTASRMSNSASEFWSHAMLAAQVAAANCGVAT